MANTVGRDHYDTTQLESRFNKNLSLRAHPEIKPYVTNTYRVKYGGLLKLFLCKPSVKKNLHYMHMMTSTNNTEEQFVQNEADNIRSANDILNYQCAKSAGILVSENDRLNLVQCLQKSLENDGLEKEFIDAILSGFDTSLTCEEYVSVFVNLHLLKSCGFSHDRMFFACLNDLRNSGDRDKSIQLTARYYVAILKSNDNFNTDSVRESFIKNTKKYANRAPQYKPDEQLVQEIGSTGLATLNTIRQNALFNVKSFLASEKKTGKTYTSLEVYAARDSFPTIKFTSKQLEKLAKAISIANKEPISLAKSFNGFPVSFNCFLCSSSNPNPSPPVGQTPSSPRPPGSGSQQALHDELEIGEGASSSDRPDFQPPITFVDRVIAKFNVLRLEPKNSRAAVDSHYTSIHTCLTQSQVNDLNGHSYIFFCSDCLHNNFCEAIICCPTHYESHNKILHSKTLTHYRVLTKLREIFKDDSCMQQVVDKYLLTICNFCKLLFPDKESRDTHTEKICVPRHITHSIYYGEPLTSTPTFKTHSTLEAEKQERVTHLVSCLKNISKHILKGPQTVSANPSVLPTDRVSSATVGSTPGNTKKKLDLFSTLILEETQMDINTFDSPRSRSPSPAPPSPAPLSPAPSNASVVSDTEAAALSSKPSSSTATLPARQRSRDASRSESDYEVRRTRDAPCKPTKRQQRQQKETKTEKRRQFRLDSREAIEDHKRDRLKTGNASETRRDARYDENDDDDDDEGGNNSPADYDVDANENGIENQGDEPEGSDRDRMDVNEGGREETNDDRRHRTRERREETETEEERRTDRREARGRNRPNERERSGESITVRTEGTRRHTPERDRESRGPWRKSGGPSTRVKSMTARRRLRYGDEDDDEDETEEEVRVVSRPRHRATARMHTSPSILKISRPSGKKTVSRHYFESDQSRSPSPQSTPPSKRRKEVRVREVARQKKRRPKTYMVLNSDSESE